MLLHDSRIDGMWHELVGKGVFDVAKRKSATSLSILGSSSNRRFGPFGVHIAFKFGKDHQNSEHRIPAWTGSVETFADADHVDIVLLEEIPELDEIPHTPRDSVQFERHDVVDFAGGDISLKTFQLRAFRRQSADRNNGPCRRNAPIPMRSCGL